MLPSASGVVSRRSVYERCVERWSILEWSRSDAGSHVRKPLATKKRNVDVLPSEAIAESCWM